MSTNKHSNHCTWVLETEVFSDHHLALRDAVLAEGGEVICWSDDWWSDGRWPRLQDRPVIFHGSLGNAAKISEELPWQPGALCDVAAFHCSRYLPTLAEYAIHRSWRKIGVQEFVTRADQVFLELGIEGRCFVRPDSPLKAFAGRVLQRSQISLSALDFGFYYDDPDLPILVAPCLAVGEEWRFVIVDGNVVAGSGYLATGRSALEAVPSAAAWAFAGMVAQACDAPQSVYVMDVAQVEGELRVLELNPFSGADLYACDRAAIVRALARKF